MRVSCKYCGRFHRIGETCLLKPRYDRPRNSRIDKFRKTAAWVHKRENILERDGYRCRLCELEKVSRRYNPGRLSIHHIEPLAERWDLRLVDDNLLTTCDSHHRKAEDGEYSRELLHELARVSPRG